MNLRRKALYGALLGLCLLTGGLSCSKPKPDEAVARVGETVIRVEDLQRSLRRQVGLVSKEVGDSSKIFFQTKERVLNDLIDKKLLLNEATNKGTFYTEEDFNKEITRYKSSYTEVGFQKMLQESDLTNDEWLQLKRENFIITKFLKGSELGKRDFSPEEVQAYYTAHLEEYKVPESVHVRQIVTDTKEKAESILRRIQNGENFAKLARDLSLSPDRKGGGDLGFISRGTFPREFEVCFSMNPGEISPIIPSVYGFHLFKVLEKRPAQTMELIEVQEKIVGQLKQADQQRALKELIENLRKQSKVEINRDLLKRIQL